MREKTTQRFAIFLNVGIFIILSYISILMFGDSQRATSLERIVLILVTVLLGLNCLQLLSLRNLQRQKTKIERDADCDELTGAMSWACFEEILDEEVRRSARYHYPLALCFFDLDDFKSLNTSFGQEHGNAVLRRFAQFMIGAVRFTDIFGRYRDDEFCVLLPHTDLVRAEKFISRVLMTSLEQIDCGFCAGVTPYRAGETKSQFLIRAGLALENAKREGKKRIRCLIGHDDNCTVVSF